MEGLLQLFKDVEEVLEKIEKDFDKVCNKEGIDPNIKDNLEEWFDDVGSACSIQEKYLRKLALATGKGKDTTKYVNNIEKRIRGMFESSMKMLNKLHQLFLAKKITRDEFVTVQQPLKKEVILRIREEFKMLQNVRKFEKASDEVKRQLSRAYGVAA